MTRSAEPSPGVDDAVRQVHAVLRAAGRPIGGAAVITGLRAAGMDEATAKRLWEKARPRLGPPEVVKTGRTYGWAGAPDPALALREAMAALERLVKGRVPPARKDELVAAIRAAFRGPGDAATPEAAAPSVVPRPAPPRPGAQKPTPKSGPAALAAPGQGDALAVHGQGDGLAAAVAELTARCADLERQLYAADTRSPEVRQAQERQLRIDAVRALAELAMEIEELTANETEPSLVVDRVRARVHREGLEPIGRAGEETTFDRAWHKPIGGGIRDGETVSVVRPGYRWHAPGEDVLLGKAIVEE